MKYYSATQIAKRVSKIAPYYISTNQVQDILKELLYLDRNNNPNSKASGCYIWADLRGKKYIKWFEEVADEVVDRFIEKSWWE